MDAAHLTGLIDRTETQWSIVAIQVTVIVGFADGSAAAVIVDTSHIFDGTVLAGEIRFAHADVLRCVVLQGKAVGIRRAWITRTDVQ